MATSSYGTQASSLALQLAPPPPPRYVPALQFGHVVAFLVLLGLGVYGLYAGSHGGGTGATDAQNRLVGWGVGIVGLGLLPVLFVSVVRQARARVRRHRAYTATWPALVHVWQSAMVCLRCHCAFFPAGALPVGPGPGEFIPVPAFRAAVNDIGSRLAAAGSP